MNNPKSSKIRPRVINVPKDREERFIQATLIATGAKLQRGVDEGTINSNLPQFRVTGGAEPSEPYKFWIRTIDLEKQFVRYQVLIYSDSIKRCGSSRGLCTEVEVYTPLNRTDAFDYVLEYAEGISRHVKVFGKREGKALITIVGTETNNIFE